MAGGFCERANRRGMVGDGYVSAGHPLFAAGADRLRHAERALSYRAGRSAAKRADGRGLQNSVNAAVLLANYCVSARSGFVSRRRWA